jgi:alpha-beta hydrolase superfamily lysophospholipase
LFKRDFDLKTDEDIKNFKVSPMDETVQIANGHYPILILCADSDEAVYPPENTLLFEQKMKALHANVIVVHKPGFKHHPHSLPDPTLIVDFINRFAGQKPD